MSIKWFTHGGRPINCSFLRSLLNAAYQRPCRSNIHAAIGNGHAEEAWERQCETTLTHSLSETSLHHDFLQSSILKVHHNDPVKEVTIGPAKHTPELLSLMRRGSSTQLVEDVVGALRGAD